MAHKTMRKMNGIVNAGNGIVFFNPAGKREPLKEKKYHEQRCKKTVFIHEFKLYGTAR